MSKKWKKAKTNSGMIKDKLSITDDAPIFEFINPNSNDKLSNMSGEDLQELIVLIDDYYIQLKNRLGLEQNITFGLEIEFEHAMYERVNEQINTFLHGTWKTKHDNSLDNGAEINSPILRDTNEAWKDLNKVCQIITSLGSIDTKSGGHIHIGAHVLGNKRDAWLNFIKLWSVYENIIYRFAYGNRLTARPTMLKYAEPMTKDFWRYYEQLKAENASYESIISRLSYRRMQAVNFENVSRNNCNQFLTKNTIEFRCPNGSMDPAIWQNNVNLFVNLLLYSKSNNYNDDIITSRHNINDNKCSNLKWYNEIYLEQALELCDILFNNNFDKVYFLKQYLKSFEVCKNSEYIETKKLSKEGVKKIL